jgi:hypothetical protein
VEHWIQHTSEPSKLWLAWQAPDSPERFRWAVGQLISTANGLIFHYLTPGKEFEAVNQGRTYEQLLASHFSGYPAFSLKQVKHREGVLEAFKRRLPPRSREDFLDYQRHFRLPGWTVVSDFALLGITEGKLPNDGFSLVDPFSDDVEFRDVLLEVAGFRYREEQQRENVRVGCPVSLVPEPTNCHDPHAVAVHLSGQTIGYINRLQAPAFLRLLADCRIEAWIERVNGKPSHPRLFIFIQIRPRLSVAA